MNSTRLALAACWALVAGQGAPAPLPDRYIEVVLAVDGMV